MLSSTSTAVCLSPISFSFIIFLIFLASQVIIDIMSSPLAVELNTSLEQYANPHNLPMPLKPLSSPSFLSESAILLNVLANSELTIPVALSVIVIVLDSGSRSLNILPVNNTGILVHSCGQVFNYICPEYIITHIQHL